MHHASYYQAQPTYKLHIFFTFYFLSVYSIFICLYYTYAMKRNIRTKMCWQSFFSQLYLKCVAIGQQMTHQSSD